MAGVQVTIAASQVDKGRLGYQAISLTHFTDTAEPSIAAGSKVEIGGALYEFTADEAGTGWGGIGASNSVYLLLTPAGAAVSWSYTTTAPTWDTAKQGWYTAGNRVIGGLYKDAGSLYTLKWIADDVGALGMRRYGDGTVQIIGGARLNADPTQPALLKKVLNIGDWDMDTTASVDVAHGLSTAKIVLVSVTIRNDANTSRTLLDTTDTAGSYFVDGVVVTLVRETGGTFDSTDFNSTSYNRGWIIIEYTP